MGKFVSILELQDPIEAHFVSGLLQSHGFNIPPTQGAIDGESMMSGRKIPILVPKEEAEDAIKLLETTRNSVETDTVPEIENHESKGSFEIYRKTIWLLSSILLSYTAISAPSLTDHEILYKLLLWSLAILALGVYLFSKDDRKHPRR